VFGETVPIGLASCGFQVKSIKLVLVKERGGEVKVSKVNAPAAALVQGTIRPMGRRLGCFPQSSPDRGCFLYVFQPEESG
jgi:hypothetical protein